MTKLGFHNKDKKNETYRPTRAPRHRCRRDAPDYRETCRQRGDISAEQSKRFDELKAELTGLEQRVERQRFLDEAERKAQGTPVHGTGDNKLDEALRSFSLSRAIASQAPDLAQRIDCGKERELSAEIAKRAGRPFQGIAVPLNVFHLEKRTITSANVSPDFGGANLVGTDHLGNQTIDVLRAKQIAVRLGARSLNGLQGDVDIPKQSAAAGNNWVAEDSELGDTDPTFGKITLQPKHCGSMTEYSRNMLLQSSPDIEQLIRMDFAAVLANALDIAALNGSGTNQPLGVLNLSGLATVTGAMSWAKILEFVETLEEANVEPTGWVMTPAMKRLLRSTAKVSSTDSVMIMESPNELAGYRAETSTNVPTTVGSPANSDALILGNWSDLMIGVWSAFDSVGQPF